MRIAVRAVAGVMLALLVIGTALLPLQSELFTRLLASRYSSATEAGLSEETMLSTAEQVRAFVVESDGTLPARVGDRPGFDEASVGHLIDVRRVLAGARVLTLVLALTSAGWVAVMWRARRTYEIGATLRLAAVLTVVLPASSIAFAAIDFDAFFAAFHGLFFSEGTWVFPYESLLILTFPEPFWVGCGIAWAGLVLLLSAVCFVTGAAIRAHEA